MWKHHTVCRACGFGKSRTPPGIKADPSADKLVPVLSLGLQPLQNAFARQDEYQSAFYPLAVLFCPNCSLGQLSIVVPPELIYKNYPYITSRSDTMRKHFGSLWSFIRSERNPVSIIEIGSNDGYMLQYAKENGSEIVCGVDPSENLSQEARDRGIQTITGILCQETAKIAKSCVPVPDVILARHVFGHVDDLSAFMKAIDYLSTKDTLVVIEVPWAKRMIERTEFDTSYFEHLSYITIKAMDALLQNTPFRLHRVHEFPVHGGALGIMIRRRDHESKADESVQKMMWNENVTEKAWKEMAECAKRSIKKIKAIVSDALAAGKTVCGYGASAKSTVWLNACGFTRKEIKFVTDTTPQKQWCTIPGTDIPVVDPGALLREKPDYAILFAWNYLDEVMSKEHLYREGGGQFIIPHENLE